MDFWLDLASTYTYLAAMRIDATARWRPFTLGPIFAAKGWATSPFNLDADKGRYMWRDLERSCAAQGLPFARPSVFPRNSIPALRVAIVGCDRGWGPAFCRAALRANFADDRDIAEAGVIDELLAALSLDGPAIRAEADSPAYKPRLRANTEEAQRLGIFGAPTFVVGNELFWGNDRLDQAIAWQKIHA